MRSPSFIPQLIEASPETLSDEQAADQHAQVKFILEISERQNRKLRKECDKKKCFITIDTPWQEFPNGWTDSGHNILLGNTQLIELVFKKLDQEDKKWTQAGKVGYPPIFSKYYNCVGTPCPSLSAYYNGF